MVIAYFARVLIESTRAIFMQKLLKALSVGPWAD